jgi:hypothetical protein
MFLFHYPGLRCPVYCWGWFCRFSRVDSITWLPCPLDLFLLISVHVHTRVYCLMLPPVPDICFSAVEHTHCHVARCIVLLPELGTLTQCGLLSPQTGDTTCSCHLFLCAIFCLCRSQWPRGLRPGSVAERLLGPRVRIPQGA